MAFNSHIHSPARHSFENTQKRLPDFERQRRHLYTRRTKISRWHYHKNNIASRRETSKRNTTAQQLRDREREREKTPRTTPEPATVPQPSVLPSPHDRYHECEPAHPNARGQASIWSHVSSKCICYPPWLSNGSSSPPAFPWYACFKEHAKYTDGAVFIH